MTNRERFKAICAADPAVDRCPIIEWATWWDETISIWETEGLPKNTDGYALYDHFGLDRNYQFWFPR